MPWRPKNVREVVGAIAFVLALLFMIWLPLGVVNMVPFWLDLPGDGQLRSHAGLAVGCLLVAAWAFWER